MIWSRSTHFSCAIWSTSNVLPSLRLCSNAPHVIHDMLPIQAIGVAVEFSIRSILEHIHRENYKKHKKALKRGPIGGDKENASDLLRCVAHTGAAA